MLKTAHRSLLPAALLSALVGLAGCHISIGSGSSKSPNTVRTSKPAKRSPSRDDNTAGSHTTSKPIPKGDSDSDSKSTADSEPTRDTNPDDKTSDGPHRDQPTTDPKRTKPSSDPVRTQPDDDEPARTPKYIGGKKDGGGEEPADPTADESANTRDRPGSLTAPQ